MVDINGEGFMISHEEYTSIVVHTYLIEFNSQFQWAQILFFIKKKQGLVDNQDAHTAINMFWRI